MTEITQTVAGRIHSVILAPVTAYVLMQVADTFLETFVPRREAENLRVGHDVIASPTRVSTSILLEFAHNCREAAGRLTNLLGPPLRFFLKSKSSEAQTDSSDPSSSDGSRAWLPLAMPQLEANVVQFCQPAIGFSISKGRSSLKVQRASCSGWVRVRKNRT